MAEHKAVVCVVMPLDGCGHVQPVRGKDVGAVDAANLERVHMAHAGDCGDVAQDILGRELRRKAVFRRLGGDGAARAQHENPLHSANASL